MSSKLDFDDFVTRGSAERDQKLRLCKYAAKYIIDREHLDRFDRPVPLFIGPGTTMELFFEEFLSQLWGGDLKKGNRPLTVVSNNLGILEPIFQRRNLSATIRLFGEEVDLTNRSLKPPTGKTLDGYLAEAEARFAVISCGSIWRASRDNFLIGSFTKPHAEVLGQVIRFDSINTYLIADDWKRVLGDEKCDSPDLLFASIPDHAGKLTLIIEERGVAKAFSRPPEVVKALKKWWRKPQPTCFISYSMKDQEQAEELFQGLRQRGVKCVKWDRAILPGDPLWAKIKRLIGTHPPLVVLCGENSLESEGVKEELRIAFDSNVPVVPIMLDNCFPQWDPSGTDRELKKNVEDLRYINARQWDVQKVLEALTEVLLKMDA